MRPTNASPHPLMIDDHSTNRNWSEENLNWRSFQEKMNR